MDSRTIETFIQVADLCNFTKAAEKLGYSQSTISFQIKQLESSLGTQLFERINHTVALTDKGREFLQYAYRFAALEAEMKKQMKEQGGIHGHVRIAIADSLMHTILKPTYAAFREKYPNITLKIINASTEEMFRLLNHNEVDMVYTLDSHIYDHDYKIASEEQVSAHFVVGTEHFPHVEALKKDVIKLGELAKLPFILTEKGMSYRKLLDEKLASMSIEILPIMEIGSAGLICRLVEQGAGVSFLPDFVTKRAMVEGTVRVLPVEGCDIVIWKQLLYHKDKWLSPPVKAVMDFLSEIMVSEGALEL